jgi:hypothetical protein
MAIAGLKKLCPPALLYLVISLAAILIMAFQNYGNEQLYCLGQYSCNVSSVYLIFILKFIYVIFWTWILNLICRAGAPVISWLLVLFPLLLFFVLIALLLLVK